MYKYYGELYNNLGELLYIGLRRVDDGVIHWIKKEEIEDILETKERTLIYKKDKQHFTLDRRIFAYKLMNLNMRLINLEGSD